MAGGSETLTQQGAVAGQAVTLIWTPRGDSLGDGARGGSADHPLQVGGLEGDQDHADVLRQLPEALGVHEVVGGLAAHVGLKPCRGGLVHPGRGREKGQASHWATDSEGQLQLREAALCPFHWAPTSSSVKWGQLRHSSEAFATFFSFMISSEPDHRHHRWPTLSWSSDTHR